MSPGCLPGSLALRRQARVPAHKTGCGRFNHHLPAAILASVTWGRRFRASREGSRARALLAAEAVCVVAWVLTGEALALLISLFAGAAVVVLVLGSENPPPRQRRVR